ncbi:hypothetical protein [Halosegnis sp.]|uniref:hypothetical protein n=1 Tax=Halosegnis sp. TaxID=2864959 RepID=UPI0035D4F53C
MSRGAVVAVALVMASLVAGPATAAPSPLRGPEPTTVETTDTPGTIERSFVIGLTPATPGSVEVRLTLAIPDAVSELTVTLPANVSVTRLDGFRATDDGYEWTGTDTPTLTYDLPANQTTTGGRLDGRYAFVDVGEWTIVPTPRAGLSYARPPNRP